MADDRFWAAAERAEDRFTGTGDVREFRRHMRKLGHEQDVINERIEAIHPHLASPIPSRPDSCVGEAL